ncbi:hypothetical protein HK103_006406 [Boothiomyces macroporosus]|uniref:Uncharacterized protein n=1 Tax=Boothiomyces macroporosus TaxID=261099 RepID=A0AAD5UDV5_9FUNG|nr:hypothetical protein HK103_006406 [Boothiomyces macroporosus]
MPVTPAFGVALLSNDEYIQEYESGLNESVVCELENPVSIMIANYDYRAVIVIPNDGYNLPQKGNIGRLAVVVIMDSVVIFAQTIQAQTTINVKYHKTPSQDKPIKFKENSVLKVKLMMVQVVGQHKGESCWLDQVYFDGPIQVNEYSVDHKQVRSLECLPQETLLTMTIKHKQKQNDLRPLKLADSSFIVPTKIVASFPVSMKSKHDANILFKSGGIKKRRSLDFKVKNPVIKQRRSIAEFAKLRISE